jgi:CheY-like chemotaxis protein
LTPSPANHKVQSGEVSAQGRTSTTPQGVEQAIKHAPQAGAAARARVLLAEDDAALRRYLEVVLRRAGYEVRSAADGLEAMKALLSSEVDAVVTDAVMPHLSGQELCRFLRRHPKLKALPVVLLSGDEGARADAPEDARADAYLSKPVPPEELAACLERLLS